MTTMATECLLQLCEERHEIEDYQSGVPRWCTGCGDNAILAAVQRLCRDEGLRPEKTVFVSGIGCSSRFPHYMRTYGFHGIHGRALPVAEGIRLARPDLKVFVNTGDGDCCSIGAAHWIHAIRYNMNITVVLHDNQVYGLTKGQASPTSRLGTRSPSTPVGSFDRPINPCSFALGANARFVARGFDVSKKLPEVLTAAHKHQGAAFIEIFQNCIVYNKDVFNDFAAPKGAEDRQLWLDNGKPMLFAKDAKGITLNRDTLSLEVVDVVDGDWEAAGVIVHDVTNRSIAHMLVEMPFGPFPMALGVLYDDPRPTFETAVADERARASEGKEPNLAALLAKGQTWTVEAD